MKKRANKFDFVILTVNLLIILYRNSSRCENNLNITELIVHVRVEVWITGT